MENLNTEIPLRILIVEDSEDDAILLMRHIRRGGYTPNYLRVENGADLRKALQDNTWDLVITDHNMPSFSSEDALKIVKSNNADIPVIIVSGSIGEDLAVAAMRTGAHDYIMKDNLTRLVPAIERELRESASRSARRKAEEMIKHMAFHDSLTGLTNRHEFENRLRRALSSVRQHGKEHVLLYLDLDQFKIVNDTCGHIAGDELLKQIADVLQKRMRDTDTLARLGGDEFGVLLEDCAHDHALGIADELLKTIRDFRFTWDKKSFVIGASIGAVIIADGSKTMTDLMRSADLACYEAKERGRNRVYMFRENDEGLLRRQGEMQWVARINEAIEHDRLVLHKQCIISLQDDQQTIQHSEFLLRMQGENGQLILPGAFIPAAERYNVMPDLDRWVIHEVFEYLAGGKGQAGFSPGDKAFINLSGASLSDHAFFPYIHEQLREFGIPPAMICFEITETAAITNLRNVMQFINEIRSEGCEFALDDFGSGLSSFSYLKTLPVNYIKIDGNFVRDMLSDPMDCAIVDAINQIGHTVGLQTIAEFVENEEILNKLKDMGVDYAQGYGIAHPGPLTE